MAAEVRSADGSGGSQDPTAIAVLSRIEGPGLRDVGDPAYERQTALG
jgi:hypothetical protein